MSWRRPGQETLSRPNRTSPWRTLVDTLSNRLPRQIESTYLPDLSSLRSEPRRTTHKAPVRPAYAAPGRARTTGNVIYSSSGLNGVASFPGGSITHRSDRANRIRDRVLSPRCQRRRTHRGPRRRAPGQLGSRAAGSTPCWPRQATRSGRRRIPSRATRRRPGATSWPGSPPRARPGCCGGPPTWYPACSRWRSGSGGMARTPIPPARRPRTPAGGYPRRPAATRRAMRPAGRAGMLRCRPVPRRRRRGFRRVPAGPPVRRVVRRGRRAARPMLRGG